MSFQGNFKLRYLKNTKQITLLRNIVASIVYEQRGISLEDCLVLYDLLPQLIEKCEKDEQFKKSHGSGLITTFEIIKNKFNPTHFPYKPKKELVNEIKDSLFGFIPSEAAYFGWSRNPLREKSYEVIPVSLKLRLPKIQDKRSRIGVGYRDKGYLKNLAKDGSPSWKQVGRISANLEREFQERPEDSEAYLSSLQQGSEKRKTAQRILDLVKSQNSRT
jgi:hypothetical protein